MGLMNFFKNIFGKQDNAASRRTNANVSALTAKSKKIIDMDLPDVRLFEIGDKLDEARTRFIPKHLGRFINTAGGILTLGICVKKHRDFTYKQGEQITLIYSSNQESYLITANLVGMRKAGKRDLKILKPLIDDREYKLHLKELWNIEEPSKFMIADILVTKESRRHQRREHVRASVNWDVHFSLADPDMGPTSVQKKQVSTQVSEIVEMRGRHFEIKTTDISEGGFKSPVKEMVPKGTQIECEVEITDKMIKTGKIIGIVVDCVPSKTNPEYFELRVQFTDVPDSEKEILLSNIEEHIPPPIDAKATLTVSENKMEASIQIEPPKQGGNDFSHELFKEFLARKTVVFGINDDVLASLARHPLYHRDIVVAHGLPVANGEDAEFIYYVETEAASKPKELEDGTIDYKNLGLQQEVRKDELLCEKKPATQGRHGSDVMGHAILAVPGKDKTLLAGTNTFLSEDESKLFAEIDGNASFVNGKINVFDTYVVKGDVCLATGDIKYLGSVLVKGDVQGGFSVQATGDVTVYGSVGAAYIETGGSLLIRGGFEGGKDGKLFVTGDAKIRFIEGGTVTVRGNLEATYLLDAIVNCGGAVNVMGGDKGDIRGGHVTALTAITANFLGNEHASASTVVEVGSDSILEERFEDVCSELESYKKTIEKFETLSALRDSREITPKEAEELKNAEEYIEEAQAGYAEFSAEFDTLSEKMKLVGHGIITAKRTAYDTVKVIIGSESLSLHTVFSAVNFTLGDGGVDGGDESIKLSSVSSI